MNTIRFGQVLLAALALCILALSTPLQAQTSFRAGGKSQFTLNGTSTLHDWSMIARSFQTTATLILTPDNGISGITDLSVTLPVTNLKSEKNGLNENAWEALHYEDHKQIQFNMTSGKVVAVGARYQITVVGNLSIAGKTRSITLTANATVNPDGSVSCTGTLPLKLSQFGIERPSFMLGTMSVGDAMTLSYTLVLVKQ
jgi:hypothetical protein